MPPYKAYSILHDMRCLPKQKNIRLFKWDYAGVGRINGCRPRRRREFPLCAGFEKVFFIKIRGL
jgi:hypothetical protein